MSYALNKLNVVSVLDPVVALKSSRNFAVFKTGSTISYKSISADGDDLTQLNWDADPPNPNTIVSRRIVAKFNFRVVLTGTTTETNLLDGYLGEFGAARFAPIAQIINVTTASINDTNVSMNVKNLITCISQCNMEDDDYVETLSGFPSMKDFYADYSDFVANGDAVNPLRHIGNNGFYQGRGGWNYTIVANTPTSATVDFTVYEPLWLSPFLSVNDDEQGFHGVQTFKLSMVCSNVRRVWSNCVGGGNPATITNVAVSLTEKPELQFKYISAGLLQNIPRSLVYNYHPLIDYKTSIAAGGNIASGAQFTNALSSLITFPAIPKRIYIFCRKAVGSLTYNDSDTFSTIDELKIEYDNRQSLFASCDPYQLYQISQQNGLKMSYTQTRLHTGMIMIIDVGKDLSLVNDDEATGLSISKQFQVTVTGTNLYNDACPFELFVVASLDALMTIEDNRAITQSSIVSKNDILTARNAQEYAEYTKPDNYFGGSFLKGLKKIAKSVVKHAPQALEFVKDKGLVSKGLAMTGNPAMAMAAKSMGYGLVPDYVPMEPREGGARVGGARVGGARVGGAQVGGMMASKQKLKSRMVRGSGFSNYDDNEDEC